MEEEEAGILEAYELQFSDLMLFSSNKDSRSSFSSEEIERLESIARSVMENLGPTGPGLLTITGVPNASHLRRTLLPLARRLALLNSDHRKRLLKLKYVQGVEITGGEASHEGGDNHNREHHYPAADELRDFQDSEFKNLSNSFKELGFCMMEVGLCLARVCDRAIGGQELEQSLLESFTAKGRLIHYHSTLDNLILKEAVKRQQSTKRKATQHSIRNEQPHINGNEARSCENHSNLWQQWHYDYGIFTVLTAPYFILPCHKQTPRENGCFCRSCEQECPSPSGHTYLEIYDLNKNRIQKVRASPESFVVQVGESADILSKGKLCANLHSVHRPVKVEDLSRETFVVFLQPAWNKAFSLADYPVRNFQSNCENYALCTEETSGKLAEELHKIVPPLGSRLKDGMTFAEFSKETTKQYYGGNGLQSKR